MAKVKAVQKDNEVMFNMFGMERQQLHNTALFMIYDPRVPRELKQAAEKYLLNLLIAATKDLSENWMDYQGGKQ